MWMTVAGVRAGRPPRPATVLLTNRSRSAVLPIGVDDPTAIDVARAHGDGFSAGGIDLLLAVVAGLGARIHYFRLAEGGPAPDASAASCTAPTPAAGRPRAPSGSVRAPRLRLADLSATAVLTDDRRVELSAGQALALAMRSGAPFDVPSPLRTRLVPLEPGVTAALARNAIEDSVDALRVLLDRARASDFRRSA
ncbi:hypothetical protein [Actinomycetospora sp. TBRC 11914]|uniref:hypothetical protein n=1 Tax=Actinomycetospora sp. TBRC 11914 TaxID=2729387 RepID=UPI00145E93D8|nr:hypothetical protein [Actinomycetospora sp. TBRC 11914]NMO91512.1 hypothetical protein [Actinomycetospora sp. TBRC 11914]